VHLAAKAIDVTDRQTLELVAGLFDYRDWATCAAVAAQRQATVGFQRVPGRSATCFIRLSIVVLFHFPALAA
jgi:hypothetical protein